MYEPQDNTKSHACDDTENLDLLQMAGLYNLNQNHQTVPI